MATDFFPNVTFAIVFGIVLFGWMCVASYHDLKTLRVPKSVTMSLLVVGLLMSTARGAWLGVSGKSTWLMTETNIFLGGLDGLVFGFVGAVSGFALFFVLWIFGVCGGGDVKLATALGAWVGTKFLVFILGLALAAIFVLTIARIILAIAAGKPSSLKSQPTPSVKTKGKAAAEPKRAQWRLMSYSLPLTIAVVAFFVIGFWKQISGLWNPQGG